jgi:hypothetical protein
MICMQIVIEHISLNGPPKVISNRRCIHCKATETEVNELVPNKNGIGPECPRRCVDGCGRPIAPQPAS